MMTSLVIKKAGDFFKFILEHWHIVLLIVVLVVYSRNVYNLGYSAADTAWIAENKRQVNALNESIDKLKYDSEQEAKALRASAVDLKARLDLLVISFPTVVAHDSQGNILKCDGKEVIPYLGPDFTDSWNRLNEEGKLK